MSFKNSLEHRAMAAYWRGAGPGTPQPTTPHVAEHDGKDYVVLYNVNGVLAVYRVTNRGALKRLKRWPDVL